MNQKIISENKKDSRISQKTVHVIPQDISSQSDQTIRVSFVLATKNRSVMLEKTLMCLRAMLTPQDELIVIDGKSIDKTSEVIARHSDIIHTLISEDDTSPANAYNKGFRVARGEYVRPVTDDDEIYPDAFEQAIAVLERHTEVDFLLCGGTKQYGKRQSFVYVPPGTNYGKKSEDAFRYGACGAGFIIRRRLFEQVGMSPEGPAADGEFVAQCIAQGIVVRFCRIHLFNHPIYEHSTVMRKKYEHELDLQRMIKQYCSQRYYMQFRIETWMKKNFVSRIIRRSHRMANRMIRGASHSQSLRPAKEYIWDGGLS